ncbi:MAG: universal stress protein [Deltaproteobacteria bacterium]|nr:universal stress protein [Deltaproteobacteria bacterium]
MLCQKILIAVDGSENARRAADHAAGIAKLSGGEVLLVHCHRPFPEYLGEPYLQNVVNKTLKSAQEIVRPSEELFEGAGIRYSTRILEGPARDKICDVARIEECDLIVMGSRGRTDFEGLVLGSVAHRVLHSTPCPVLIVR